MHLPQCAVRIQISGISALESAPPDLAEWRHGETEETDRVVASVSKGVGSTREPPRPPQLLRSPPFAGVCYIYCAVHFVKATNP